jgi:serine/threonine protein kinase
MLLDSKGKYLPIYSFWGSHRCAFEDFTLHRMLGRGANGEVWLAEYEAEEKMVALKIFKVGDPSKRSLLEAIRTEEVLLATLDHQNIPKLYCSMQQGDNVILAMEYIMAVDLHSQLGGRSKPMPLAFTEKVLRQVINALGYVHSRGVIHRDIKLENLLMTSQGDVYLIDFDHATYAPHGSDLPAGTTLNNTPEMLQSEHYDDGVDWWALGLVLYELVTLHHPFQEFSSQTDALFERVAKGVPRTGIRRVDRLLGRLCDLDPDKRWTFGKGNFQKIRNHKLV